jgi:mannose-1-phosphate guanylyltransferase/phosphomannomutase
MYSVAKILEMIAHTGKRLGEYDDSLPRLFAARRGVNCSWELKGKVMRNIMQHTQGLKRDLVDGVKVYFEGDPGKVSVLLIPDKERPLFHVVAEARGQETADAVADDYERKIVGWRDDT